MIAAGPAPAEHNRGVSNAPPLQCAICGTTDEGVAPITYALGGKDRTEPLCGACKASFLERRRQRVRTGRRRRQPFAPALGGLGRVLIALGAAVLALAVLAGAYQLVFGDDGGDPCAGAELRAGCRPD